MIIQFDIPGNPIALKRHRKGKWGNYDPSATDKADLLAKAMQWRPETPFNEPLVVTMSFLFSRPKSHYGTGKNKDKLKPKSPTWHTGTPDLDNLEKFVMDALKGFFWKDDAICCQKFTKKTYTEGTPGIWIQIKTLERP
jgi:Holliday junction resolvase RusA-like endonuclease